MWSTALSLPLQLSVPWPYHTLFALSENIRLERKGLKVTNALAYFTTELNTTVKVSQHKPWELIQKST